jgi:hypothetical protein
LKHRLGPAVPSEKDNRKIVLTRDEAESSDRTRAGCKSTKVETQLVAVIDDADGRANERRRKLLTGCKDRAANNCSTAEASGLRIESAVQKIANSMLGTSTMKVADN